MSVIKRVIGGEKATNLRVQKNVLIVGVERRATKADIKKEVENVFNVKVVRVNTLITPKGEKKAYVTFAKEFKVDDILSKMGLV
ncbi:50S ribosomal protein L23 [Sulfolobales archaeon HS-7]|nr:50S ribosomal protein L23 [Sulfolobales archaeon HS-7]